MNERADVSGSGLRPSLVWFFVALSASSGCAAPTETTAANLGRPAATLKTQDGPTRTEADYIRQTARTIYRTGPIERSRNFLPGADLRLCIRSPRSGDYDHTLLTLQRRITDDFIPQAADDVVIDRSRAGALPCRRLVRDWISLR